jgi:methyl-accepting chemotaxis protein
LERLKRWFLGLSIGAKLQLSIVFTVLAAMTFALFIIVTSYRGSIVASNQEILQARADAVSQFVAASRLAADAAAFGGPEQPLAERLDRFKPYASTRIFVFGPEKRVAAATPEVSEYVGLSLTALPGDSGYFDREFIGGNRPAVAAAQRPGDGQAVFCAFSPVPGGGTVLMDVAQPEILSPVNSFLFQIAGITAVAFLAVILVIWLVADRTVVRPILRIMGIFDEIGKGNYEARAPVPSERDADLDELGKMGRSLNDMLDRLLNLVQSSAERDSIQKSIMSLLDEISGLAEGDLTARAEVTEDFTGAIADSFNEMAEQLSEVVKNVKDVTLQVISTSQDVSRSTENLAETSEMQAVQVGETIEAINEMSKSIQQVAENAGRSAGVSEQSTSHAKEGAEAVRATNRAMESIREHAQETARAIKRLGESSQEIGNIVQLINDIADRTSILALNASIQAAMAGDAGRGFAVVAEEVQRLAERSTNATKQIDTLIKNIQGEINEAGSSMEESIQRVVEGSRLADGARNKLQEIETVSTQLGELIQSISMASKQQAQASEEIAKTMEEVGEISSQTSAASRQTAVSMKSLAQMSSQLNESVSVFRLAEDQHRQPDLDALT